MLLKGCWKKRSDVLEQPCLCFVPCGIETKALNPCSQTDTSVTLFPLSVLLSGVQIQLYLHDLGIITTLLVRFWPNLMVLYFILKDRLYLLVFESQKYSCGSTTLLGCLFTDTQMVSCCLWVWRTQWPEYIQNRVNLHQGCTQHSSSSFF